MNIHEYQAKLILQQHGVPTLDGVYATTVDDAYNAAKSIDSKLWVVKAQIHAGGRGAGHFLEAKDSTGGVRLARSLDEVRAHAGAMLNHTLVTKQTGPQGKRVLGLYVENGCNIDKEYYLSMLIDRSRKSIVMVVSAAGGMDIEDVAEKDPDQVVTVSIDMVTGVMPYHVRRVCKILSLDKTLQKDVHTVLSGMYKSFLSADVAMIEINPLVKTADNKLIALDCKMSFDDNALPRQPDIQALADTSEQDPVETEAEASGLTYIKLDGSIGCMVNGAGLAMATMDIILLKGSRPANFLDVGGGATKERISKAFTILCNDPNVKGILINIFGGIMRCDIVAEGIVSAAKETKSIDRPIVVRLAGTKVKEGKEILEKSGLPILPADDLDDAASKIVAACTNNI